MSLDEVRLELADVRHELKSTQVEFNLLDELVKKQTLSSSSKQGESNASLEKRVASLEKLLEKAATDLRSLSSHTNQAIAKLDQLEHEISSHEKQLDEIVKLKGTLTSISQAIGENRPSNSVYKVKAGDSLEKIARAHQMTVSSLKNLNHLKNDKIVVGQELRISDDSR
jgi:peptidoglycan endopeptidase LytE